MDHPHTGNSVTGITAGEVLGEAEQTLSLAQRRAFMRLPLEQRRHILTKQAEGILVHYQEDLDWQELQTNDLIEY